MAAAKKGRGRGRGRGRGKKNRTSESSEGSGSESVSIISNASDNENVEKVSVSLAPELETVLESPKLKKKVIEEEDIVNDKNIEADKADEDELIEEDKQQVTEIKYDNLNKKDFNKRPLFTTTLPKYTDASEAAYDTTEIQVDADIKMLAENEWLNQDKVKKSKKHAFDNKKVDKIFNKVIQNGELDTNKISSLEFEACLEKFLWPNYSEDSTFNHTLLIILLFNQKEATSKWELFNSDATKFEILFYNAMELVSHDNQGNTKQAKYFKSLKAQVQIQLKIALVKFFNQCFLALEIDAVREQCLKLTSISIWYHLSSESKRKNEIAKLPQLKKVWKHSDKKALEKDEHIKAQWIKEYSFLADLIKLFLNQLYSIDLEYFNEIQQDNIVFCERIIELLIDLLCQLPTRRFFNTLLKDMYVLNYCKSSKLFNSEDIGIKFKQLVNNLDYYINFEINDFNGQSLNKQLRIDNLYKDVNLLIEIAYQYFQEDLRQLTLSNVANLTNKQGLLNHLNSLDEDKIYKLCDYLNMRIHPVVKVGDELNDKYSKEFLLECLVDRFENRLSQIDQINQVPLFPNEEVIFDPSVINNQFYNSENTLALPKLNLQFLTLHDYLIRNFELFRLDANYQIRQDIEDAIKRLKPRYIPSEKITAFSGWSRMAVEINGFNIVDIKKPNLGQLLPSNIIADVKFDIGKYTQSIQQEWKALKKYDVLFLITIKANINSSKQFIEGDDFKNHFGITNIRGCQVIDLLDDENQLLNPINQPINEDYQLNNPIQTVRVELDPSQYQQDIKNNNHCYDTFNVLLRRKPKDNNFKAVLESIRNMMNNELLVLDWLKNIILGYGNPMSAHYSNFDLQNDKFDFYDTFINYEHLKSCFKGVEIKGLNQNMEPPFILNLPTIEEPSNKKQKSEVKLTNTIFDKKQLYFNSYKINKKDPYNKQHINKNQIPFTTKQIEAIYSGCNKGLSLIVGPPGTGKTDVAVQIINNLYHAYPNQKILLITHSNHALNQLFNKIAQLDINPTHLLRLGHGHEDLNLEESFSMLGRVNHFLDQRIHLLKKVEKLVKIMGLNEQHAYSCESAMHFFNEYVMPKWNEYVKLLGLNLETNSVGQHVTNDMIEDNFPFKLFFDDLTTPLFSKDLKESIDNLNMYYNYINNLFEQIKSILPFEILRNNKERADYLLVKEAKIIAMTCTYAALKRKELLRLGFTYNNLIIEEAAQILEVESFIPFVLQKDIDNLQRVTLIGDHYQLPPIVKNIALQKYANFNQSMFFRLIKLGVPIINLDYQGRGRPILTDLYRYRYNELKDLEIVKQNQYTLANAGFKFTHQFIHVESQESSPIPFYYQNLNEAEYIVALYMFMRLIGYPASKITILTTYNGQLNLINDVIKVRCKNNPLFGYPKISTVDKYQGEQNDYILLSLVRTKSVGHIKDLRRLTVALSRARLGLYIVGDKQLFLQSEELSMSLNQLKNNDQLILVKDEQFPTTRKVKDKVDGVEIKGLKELGELVYEMTKQQLEMENQLVEQGVDVVENKQMEEVEFNPEE